MTNDELTLYLYDKYARDYFIRKPAMVPALIRSGEPSTGAAAAPFNTARYDEVAGMPKQVYVILTSYDRLRRLDEMRVLVAIYFNNAPERADAGIAEPVSSLMREMLGLDPADDPLQRWLKSRSTVPVPKPFAEPLPGEQGPVALTEPIQALLRDTGIEQTWLVGDALSQLDNAITDMDLKISVYPLQYATSSPAPGEPTADDALRDIETAKGVLLDRHAAFLELAAADGDQLAAVQATRQQRIEMLTAWTADRNSDLAWHWPATEPESGDPHP